MKYRTTVQPISEAIDVAPPDDVYAWRVHSFTPTADHLVVLWFFDFEMAAARKKEEARIAAQEVRLADRVSYLRTALNRAFSDLNNLLQRGPADSTRDNNCLQHIRSELDEALRADGSGPTL